MDRYPTTLLIVVGCLACLMAILLVPSQEHEAGSGAAQLQAQQHLERGKILFETKCQRCHGLSGHHRTLTRLRERVPSGKWLMAFIRNSSALIQGGDAFANKLYEESSKAEMPAFPEMSDLDIAEMVMYIDRQERK